MKVVQVISLCIVLVELCVAAINKKSIMDDLPWPGYPFARPPNNYFGSLQEAEDYYEAYDLGGNIDFETEAPKTKPDRKSSFAFKEDLASAMHDFTFDLFSNMIQNQSSRNAVISPLSIYTALSMLTLGLGGESKSQALTVMHGENIDDIHESMDKLSDTLFNTNRANVTLTKANRIFVDRSIQLYKAFKRSMKKDYDVSAKKVSFMRQPEQNRRWINRFVQRHTNRKIKNLAPLGSITSSTRVFIANAMYLKAYWATPFTVAKTGRFHISSDKVISTKTMTSMGPCSYITDSSLQAKVVRNPLKSELSMIMIVPHMAGDFTRLEDSRGKKRVREALERIYETQNDWMTFCQLSMPKFKIDYSADNLIKVLSKMGMTNIFNPQKADLSQMTPSYKGLFVSDLRHKASIEVNEKGVEGAAATSVAASQRMMPRPVPVDRPFMFIIRDDITGATLFTGKVVQPSQN